VVPLQFLSSLLPDPSSLGPRTRGKTCIGCLLRGVRDRQPQTYYIYNICDHQAAFAELGSQAIAYTTGVPAMVGAVMMVTGQWMQPGVWNMEQLDPDPFLKELEKRGLPWEIRKMD
jgi:saccharopine dehydrogenase (NAD+, L-lysine-forming)